MLVILIMSDSGMVTLRSFTHLKWIEQCKALNGNSLRGSFTKECNVSLKMMINIQGVFKFDQNLSHFQKNKRTQCVVFKTLHECSTTMGYHRVEADGQNNVLVHSQNLQNMKGTDCPQLLLLFLLQELRGAGEGQQRIRYNYSHIYASG